MRALLLVSALATLAACAPAKPTPKVAEAPKPFALEFIDDDYPRALALAKSKNVPLFVDVWAPWCHTCLSLRAYVFRDPSLARFSSKFVWAAIDSEKASNAPFVDAHPLEAWPTLFVIDPVTEKVTVKWEGGATVKELSSLLDDAVAGKSAPPIDAKITEVGKTDKAACVALARQHLPSLPKGTTRANVALAGLDCAKDTPDATFFADALTTIVIDPGDPILADDRSALYEVLIEHRKATGDLNGAKTLARAWIGFLEAEAGKATDAAARTVFDSHRMTAYVAVGEPARAIPMLEESERDFPTDYNPPARLAKIYHLLGRGKEARVAVDRALGKAYGPRKMRILALKADIARAAGDTKTERTSLDDAIALGASATLPRGYTKYLETLKARRAALDTP